MMTMTMDNGNNRAESTRIQMVSMEEDEEIISCDICGYEWGSHIMLLLHNNDNHGERRLFD